MITQQNILSSNKSMRPMVTLVVVLSPKVDRVNYGNDTATASPKGPLSSARYYVVPQAINFGYFAGGPNPSGNINSEPY